MKPYTKIPIIECGESLIPIPLEKFAVVTPHPYEILGANYGDRSPYFLRESVVNALLLAQEELTLIYPQWKILIFDAYRPLPVQQFMVDYSFNELLKSQGLKQDELTSEKIKELWEQVYQFWAIPNYDLATPPPHSTGGAIDITLINNDDQIVINMGSEIDEISVKSYPDHFANSTDLKEQEYHNNRNILKSVMYKAGFKQHPNEWWHFCLGDQMYAWLSNLPHGKYGRIINY